LFGQKSDVAPSGGMFAPSSGTGSQAKPFGSSTPAGTLFGLPANKDEGPKPVEGGLFGSGGSQKKPMFGD